MDNTSNTEDKEIGTLIDQLQNNTFSAKKAAIEPDPLKKEEIETFVIQRAGELVRESLEFMKSMKEYVSSAPNGEDMSAVANLITATSSALETLNKLVITDKKAETVVKIKEMDIQSKKEIANEDNTNRYQLTREEIFKRLISTSIPVSADVIDITP
tara:strand:- start:15494 stop:15964 length:471 start_codon:yes stop_codon:yes gene_type:complete